MTSPSRRGETWSQRCDRFTAEIRELCRTDPGARADLKSGVRQPVVKCSRMHGHLARFVSPQWSEERQQPYYTMASLIADSSRRPEPSGDQQPDEADSTAPGEPSGDTQNNSAADAPASQDQRGWWLRRTTANLGASVADGVRLPNPQALNADSAERRMHLMTRSSLRTLRTRLPELSRYLRSRGVALDWAVLLDDLLAWERSRDEVATRWLQAYYQSLYAGTDSSSTDSESEQP